MVGQSYKWVRLSICNSQVALPFQLQPIQQPAPSWQKTSHPVPSAPSSWFTTSGSKCANSTTKASKIIEHGQSQSKLPPQTDFKTCKTISVSHTIDSFMKIHLHLRHGSIIAIMDYLRLAVRCSSTFAKTLNKVTRSFPCAHSTSPTNHAPESASPSDLAKHKKSLVNVLFFEPTLFLYILDLATAWPQVGRLLSGSMLGQCIGIFRLWIYRHCHPRYFNQMTNIITTSSANYAKSGTSI